MLTRVKWWRVHGGRLVRRLRRVGVRAGSPFIIAVGRKPEAW